MSDHTVPIDIPLLPGALASIVDIAADAVIVIDDEQRIRFFNGGAEQIFGWAASEVLGRSIDLLLPEAVHRVHQGHVRDFAAGEPQSRKMAERRRIAGRRKSGEEFPAEASIAHTRIGTTHLFAVVLRDATERYRIENEQRWLAQTGRVLANSIELWPSMSAVTHRAIPLLADWVVVELLPPAVERPMALIAHRDTSRDADRELLSETIRAHRLTWQSAVDFADHHDALPASRSERPLGDALGGARTGETIVDRRDLDAWSAATFGATPSVAAAVATLGLSSLLLLPLYAGGRTLGILHLVRGEDRPPFAAPDLSLAERFSALAALTLDNARLYEESRNTIRERDDLLAIVSHDLRNPVSAIAMLTGALLRTARLDDDTVPIRIEQLEALRGAARQADGLIADLQDVSRIREGRLRVECAPVAPSTLVHDAVELFAPIAGERGLQLLEAVEPGLPDVRADRRRAVQLLANFISNAIKFSPDETPILIRAERLGLDRVRFSVRDHGPGIPADDQPRLFERYFQATRLLRAGSGLGLFIAKGIADAHGATVGVDTQPGSGSTFWCAMPLATS
jgi:PAS domain S-box-containing protein